MPTRRERLDAHAHHLHIGQNVFALSNGRFSHGEGLWVKAQQLGILKIGSAMNDATYDLPLLEWELMAAHLGIDDAKALELDFVRLPHLKLS
jgi:hypothetical protein